MIILAEELDFFCARISNIRSKTLFGLSELSELSAAIRTFSSNQPICYLSTRYVICLPHPDSRHIAQTTDYLHISKPPLTFLRLGYSGSLQRIRLKGFDFEPWAFPAFSCDCSRISRSDDTRF